LPRFSADVPAWEADPLSVAQHALRTNIQYSTANGERLLANWLRADNPMRWAILQAQIILPWKDKLGEWQDDTPDWVPLLEEIAAGANRTFGPFDRQRKPSPN
jgi:hypothetical protein